VPNPTYIARILPSIETSDALFRENITSSTQETYFAFGLCTGHLLALELDDHFNHVNRLDHASCNHAGETTDPEGLDGVEEFLGGCLLYN